ncbi:MAG: PP2C family protein-serine/threonine phosphatase [Candidatus Acidiferrum sp.]
MSTQSISWKQAFGPRMREFLQVQQRIVFVGAIVCALFAVLTPGAPILFLGACVLVIGNLMHVLMAFAVRNIGKRDFPWNWVLYLPVLAVAAALSAFVSVALLHWMQPTAGPYWYLFRASWKIVMVVCMAAGIISYVVLQFQQRLQEKNKLLEQAVAQGAVVIAEQEQELHRALEIQRGLLPKDLPQLRGTELAGAWQPARTVGGDYFDVVQFSETRLGICVGDVSGKGLTAALLMSNLQAAFRAFATAQATPAEVCCKLNTFVSGNVADDKFITFFYAVVDVEKRTLVYENAGHCPALLLRADGGTEFLRGHGALLGVIPEWSYVDETLLVRAGDRLFFYTDGVTEAENEAAEEFGYERLVRAAAPPATESAAATNRRIMDEVASFCKGNFGDDVTLVVLAIR